MPSMISASKLNSCTFALFSWSVSVALMQRGCSEFSVWIGIWAVSTLSFQISSTAILIAYHFWVMSCYDVELMTDDCCRFLTHEQSRWYELHISKQTKGSDSDWNFIFASRTNTITTSVKVKQQQFAFDCKLTSELELQFTVLLLAFSTTATIFTVSTIYNTVFPFILIRAVWIGCFAIKCVLWNCTHWFI